MQLLCAVGVVLYNLSVIRHKCKSQNVSFNFKKTKHAKFSEKSTFRTPWYAHAHERKIWRALFSWNSRFEIRPFSLLPTNFGFPIMLWPKIVGSNLIRDAIYLIGQLWVYSQIGERHRSGLVQFKVGPSLTKNMFYLLSWKPCKIDEKCFLFHLKSSFRSQDIQIFLLTFCSYRQNSLIRK